MERMIDWAAARECGFDRVELRGVISFPKRKLPTPIRSAWVYDSGAYHKARRRRSSWATGTDSRHGARKHAGAANAAASVFVANMSIRQPVCRASVPR